MLKQNNNDKMNWTAFEPSSCDISWPLSPACRWPCRLLAVHARPDLNPSFKTVPNALKRRTQFQHLFRRFFSRWRAQGHTQTAWDWNNRRKGCAENACKCHTQNQNNVSLERLPSKCKLFSQAWIKLRLGIREYHHILYILCCSKKSCYSMFWEASIKIY